MPDLIALSAHILADPTPSPSPSYDADLVTPGPIGFVVTALIGVALLLLIVDMVRRMRRVRYREEARQHIAAELASTPEPDQDADEPPSA